MPATILMVTWNGAAHTRACLASLRSSGVSDDSLLVVDNGSHDGTPELLRREGIRVVESPTNLGFARAVNRGLATIPASHDVVLLNNDVRLVPGWLGALTDCAARHPRAGVIAARLTHPDGRLQDAGTRIVWDPLCMRHYGAGEPEVGQYRSTRAVPAVSFAAAWIRREALDAAGGLDEDYFCYFEDVDLCLRLRARGWDILVCGEVTLVHDEHTTSRENDVDLGSIFRDAEAVFARKWPHPPTTPKGDVIALPYPGPDAESVAAITAVLLGMEDRDWRVSTRVRLGWGSPLDTPGEGDDWQAFLRAQLFRVPVADARPLVLGDPLGVACEGDATTAALTLRPPPPGTPRAWAGTFSGHADDVEILPLPVDPHYFFPRERREGAPLTVVATGDASDLLQASQSFRASFGTEGDARLVLVATGPLPAPDEVDGLEVRRLAWPCAAERAALHAEADVWVEPASRLGWGLFATEAAASGLGVVRGTVDPSHVRPPHVRPRGAAPVVSAPGEIFHDTLSERLATRAQPDPKRFPGGLEPPPGPLADSRTAPLGASLTHLGAARAATLAIERLHLSAALANARSAPNEATRPSWWQRLRRGT